jgi:hypothetical protein
MYDRRRPDTQSIAQLSFRGVVNAKLLRITWSTDDMRKDRNSRFKQLTRLVIGPRG